MRRAIRVVELAAVGLLAGVVVWRLAGCSFEDDGGTSARSATDQAQPDPSPADGTGIVILGDSLSAQTNEEFAQLLPGSTLDAVPGRTLVEPMIADTGMDRIAPLKALTPRWWVVALGTNDAAYAEHSADVMAADVETLLEAIGEDQCVLWVLPSVGAPADQRWIDNVARFGDIARFALGARPCSAVVEWSGVVEVEPGILVDDGIHLTDLGQRRLAEVVIEGLRAAGALPT